MGDPAASDAADCSALISSWTHRTWSTHSALIASTSCHAPGKTRGKKAGDKLMGRIRSAGRLALVEPTQAQPTTQPTQPTTQPTTRRPVGRPRGPRKAPRSKRPDPELVSIRPLAVTVEDAAKML